MTFARAPLALALALALALVGCIALPEDPDKEVDDPVVDPLPERIEGMTAEVTYVDEVAECEGGNIQVPPGRVCATRTLDAVGRIGEDELPVDLATVNGAITILVSEGGAWSFHAVVKVRALTEEGARQGLNTTWSWSHEGSDGKHALVAGPTPTAPGPADIQGVGATLESATYEVHLPEWIVLDVVAKTTNGEVRVDGFRMEGLVARTTNGAIVASGSARDVDVDTTNGAVMLALVPTQSGAYRASTTNGEILVEVLEDRAHGYAVDASTSNGDIQILLEDGDVTESPSRDFGSQSKSFRTQGYDDRDVQTTIDLTTTNGKIVVTG